MAAVTMSAPLFEPSSPGRTSSRDLPAALESSRSLPAAPPLLSSSRWQEAGQSLPAYPLGSRQVATAPLSAPPSGPPSGPLSSVSFGGPSPQLASQSLGTAPLGSRPAYTQALDPAASGKYGPRVFSAGGAAPSAPHLAPSTTTMRATPTSSQRRMDKDSRWTIHELEDMLRARDDTIRNLEHEIDELQRHPHTQQERLARLEQIFGDLKRGDLIEVEAPLLKRISDAVHQTHKLDHAEAVAHHGGIFGMEGLLGRHDDVDEERFVLGRHFLPLDRLHILRATAAEERRQHLHPVVSHIHYAGHVVHPTEIAPCVAVVADGVTRKEPGLRPRPQDGSFWLTMNGPWRPGFERSVEANRTVAQSMGLEDVAHKLQGRIHGLLMGSQDAAHSLEDALVQRAFEHDRGGYGEDARAVDWLGNMKRGMVEEEPLPQPGWQLPRWCY